MERTSSWGSAVSRLSVCQNVGVGDDEAEDHECFSAAGDIAFQGRRKSESGGFDLSLYIKPENGTVVYNPAMEHELPPSNNNYIVNPQEHLDLPIFVSTNGKVNYEDIKQVLELDKIPKLLEYVSYLTHLTVFGILGIGSFLMGWFGFVFKRDISCVSEHLAIGLTTGYLGSLTTFSGWNQKMLELSVAGHWILSFLGFLIGMLLVALSIIIGFWTAKGFKWLLKRLNMRHGSGNFISKVSWKVDSFPRQLVVTIVLLVILALLWGVSSALEINEFKNGGGEAQLWLACIVGPLGVWLRWFLATRLNECEIGGGFLKWLRFGTLIANVSAACIMAALATLKKSVNTTNCDTVITGLQFGLLGCLSTVSTFVAELYEMIENKHLWRAFVYAMVTICVSFSFGILLYYIPVSRM